MKRDPEQRLLLKVAETVGLPLCLVLELPASELFAWGAWFELQAKWQKDAAAKAGRGGRRRRK